jgi:dTDP-4-dehydrorhamnose reductase
MNSRILLTGKTGQVGAELLALLPRLGEVAAFDRHELDLSNPGQIRRTIRNVQPTVIVNAAAYTSVDQAEREEKQAHILNVEAPALMADEDDQPNPINVYGRTKLAGEEAIRAVGVPHLIFRTAWVYGTRGRNFLLTILRLATAREELRIVRDQFGSPTWSREIAKCTARVLAQLSKEGRQALSGFSGVYNMTAAGKTSWFEFAEAILEEASRTPRDVPWFAAATGGKPLVVRRVNPIPTEQYPTLARRPAYSVLSNHRLKQVFGLELPDWRSQLALAFAPGQSDDTSLDP